MKLPNRIKVGGRYYTVISYKFDKEDYIGDHHCDQQIIRIDPRYAEETQKNTLIHECLHALFDYACLEEGDTEERIVTALAYGLQALYHDNPKLKDYL